MNAKFDLLPHQHRVLRATLAAAAGLARGRFALAADAGAARIGVAGSDGVGGTAGELRVEAGHEVVFYSPDLDS